jgi:hypothetical protein
MITIKSAQAIAINMEYDYNLYRARAPITYPEHREKKKSIYAV